MNEVVALESLSNLARGIWRYRWPAMLAAWCIVLVGWPVAYLVSQPSFTAKAQVYIDTKSVLSPVLKGLTLPTNPSVQIGLMMRQLTARPNLERVIAEVGLDGDESDSTPSDIILETLRGSIVLTAERTGSDTELTNFYSISYTSRDHEVATAVVQSLISAFAENTRAQVRADTDQAIRYLDNQIRARRAQIDDVERRLRDFQQHNLTALTLISGSAGYFEQLAAAQDQLRNVEIDIQKAKSRRAVLQAEIASTPTRIRVVGDDGMPMRTAQEQRLADLRDELDQSVLKYTESYPALRKLRERIANLETEIARSPDPASTQANVLYDQLQLRMTDLVGTLAELEIQHDHYDQRVKRLQDQISTLPAIEADLNRLRDEHAKTVEGYQALIARRQMIDIGRNLSEEKGDARLGEDFEFRVIEPPSVPVDSTLLAVWHKRLALAAGVLAVGLAGGIALAFGLVRLRPPIFGQRALGEITRLPVYGVISQVKTLRWSWRFRLDLIFFVIACLLLGVTAAYVVFVQHELTYSITSKQAEAAESEKAPA